MDFFKHLFLVFLVPKLHLATPNLKSYFFYKYYDTKDWDTLPYIYLVVLWFKNSVFRDAKFFVGDSLTWADICFYQFSDMVKMFGVTLDNNPILKVQFFFFI